MTKDLGDIEIVGKSVEEIDQDTENRVNSSVPNEQRGDETGVPVIFPGVNQSSPGTPIMGAVPVAPLLATQTLRDETREQNRDSADSSEE
ncbi:hypothetical protein [Deinococcus sonorensis]|uniref:Uncharacterized protein n=2 Tax=Deinococcus sonorensis TaxID=309891 RepID=A0AAU7UB35_9DEIO